MYDLNGTILEADQAACRLLGYTADQLSSMSMTDLRPGVPLATLQQGWASVVANGTAHTEVSWRRADGRFLRLAVTAHVLQRDPIRLQVLAREAAANQPYEVTRSRRYLLQLMDGLRDSLLVVDPHSHRLLDVNRAAVALTGYTEAALMTLTITELCLPTERAGLSAAMATAPAGEDGREPYRLTWQRADGRLVPVEIVHSRTELEGETVIVASVRDISERLAAEAATRQAEAQYRSIFDSAREAVFRTSSQGGFEAANPSTAMLLGYDSPAQLMREVSSIRRLFVDLRRFEDLVALLDANGAVDDYEVQLYRRDGTTCWVSLRMHTHEQGTGHSGLQGTAIDVTAHRLAESYR